MTYQFSSQPLTPGHWQAVISNGKQWLRLGLKTTATVQKAPSQSPFAVEQAEVSAPGGRSVLFGPATAKTWSYSFQVFVYGDDCREKLDQIAAFVNSGIGDRSKAWTVTVGRDGQPPAHIVCKPHAVAPDYGMALKGAVRCALDFTVVHEGWLEPAQSRRWQIVPTLTGGLVFPVTFPVVFATSSSNADAVTFDNPGVHPVVTFHGPVGKPTIRFGDKTISLATSLGENESVTVDTRPWNLSVVDQSGRTRIRDLAPTSSKLTDFELPRGTVPVEFSGVSPAATAAVDVMWHPKRATL